MEKYQASSLNQAVNSKAKAFFLGGGGGGGGVEGGGFIMLDFQARAAKRISQTYQCCHQAKYSTVAVFAAADVFELFPPPSP